ncbi:DUF1003 domain-containing protein [Citricoccus sp. SGAir0253]|uniref:DUF1003 domain-containing protein n=1 Tax=Citricoccus sp. SGAir0253 TaxID=2567881 RepID=UPI0010CCC4C4|nr:DUF1003 domain-containing protein [Citricoccus sp. SGAir0253]QCU79336.1 DUF1003 domain-containing protein [Citricoccus sp. SGAir0253]
MADKIGDPGMRRTGLDTPLGARGRRWPRLSPNPDAFGEATEGFARFMGTPQFLLAMTVFCALWLGWNTFAPDPWRFDSAALGFTALTLVLSLQASYAAPLLLLAQNRQDDRDKVSLREDRLRAERNLADTEYLTRELAGLRIALQDVATRDFVRSEMRDAVAEITEELRAELREQVRAELLAEGASGPDADRASRGGGTRKKAKKKNRPGREARERREGDDEASPTTTLAIIAAEEAAGGQRLPVRSGGTAEPTTDPMTDPTTDPTTDKDTPTA